ncbi:ParA family protein [Catalinimonas sp. 4WD22]|uniref:ParA family protein n=1 Tax=Catalinimonas locisalis TaxID=3133978 RepID=UPI003100C4FD
MSTVVSFMSRKGGTGKTTLCAITAAAMHNRTKKSVLVIDADPQQSIAALQGTEEEPDKGYGVIPFSWDQKDAAQIFAETIATADQEYDLVFIDSPGRMEGTDVELILNASDVVIIPLIASPIDVQSTAAFLDYIGPVCEKNNVPVYGIINKRDRTLEHGLLAQLDGYNGLEVMTGYISNLVRYKRDLSTVSDLITSEDLTDEFNMYIKEFRKLIK